MLVLLMVWLLVDVVFFGLSNRCQIMKPSLNPA